MSPLIPDAPRGCRAVTGHAQTTATVSIKKKVTHDEELRLTDPHQTDQYHASTTARRGQPTFGLEDVQRSAPFR